jgi:hypothetical protein
VRAWDNLDELRRVLDKLMEAYRQALKDNDDLLNVLQLAWVSLRTPDTVLAADHSPARKIGPVLLKHGRINKQGLLPAEVEERRSRCQR